MDIGKAPGISVEMERDQQEHLVPSAHPGSNVRAPRLGDRNGLDQMINSAPTSFSIDSTEMEMDQQPCKRKTRERDSLQSVWKPVQLTDHHFASTDSKMAMQVHVQPWKGSSPDQTPR
jgi:hypothetical protein